MARDLVRLIALLALACLSGFASTASAGGPLETAVEGIGTADSLGRLEARRIAAAGATKVRLYLNWRDVAPAERSAAFDAADPASSGYEWAEFDARLDIALGERLDPIVVLYAAPRWAVANKLKPGQAGTNFVRPIPEELARFARAAATRYSGGNRPRVRYWQIWNEPNISPFLFPQFDGREAISPEFYRRMVAGAARAIHEVSGDNVVIAGGLSPFTVDYGSVESVGPLRFMREFLCMSKGARPRPTCSARVEFDVWAHHPYTTGGPTHSASNPDDVSLGDLPEMRNLLAAAVRVGHVRKTKPMRFWVTEFSWDTDPDPTAVPLRLHGRWVAEALYRMWKSGVSLVTWLMVRDEPYPSSSYQSGLYFRGSAPARDRPKPALAAFRFPFVAFRESRGLSLWGRTPTSKAATVYIERKPPGGGWRRVATLKADRFGIFKSLLPLQTTKRDFIRARQAGGRIAVPFSLTRPPDRQVRPFGD